MISSSLKRFIDLDEPQNLRDPQELEIIFHQPVERGLDKKIFKGQLLADRSKNDSKILGEADFDRELGLVDVINDE